MQEVHESGMEKRVAAIANGERLFMIGALGFALVCGIVCCTLIAAMGEPFNEDCTATGAVLEYYTGCFSWGDFVMNILVVLTGFGYFAGASYASESAGRYARLGSAATAKAVLWTLLLLTVAADVASWVLLMKPSESYQKKPDGSSRADFGDQHDWTIDVWQVFVGGLIFAAGVPFAVSLGFSIAHVGQTARLRPPPGFGVEDGEPGSSMGLELQASSSNGGGMDMSASLLAGSGGAGARRSSRARSRTSSRGRAMSRQRAPSRVELNDAEAEGRTMMYTCRALLALAVCFLMTTILSPIWNFSGSSYYTSVSQYSLFFLPVGGDLPMCLNANNTCSCQDPSTDTSTLSGGASHYFACWFSFKVYPDTVLYYAFLSVAVMVGAYAHTHEWQCARRRLRPLAEKTLPAWAQPFPNGLTVLEAVAVGAVATLFLCWWIYWYVIYGRYRALDVVNDCPRDASKLPPGANNSDPSKIEWDLQGCGDNNAGGNPTWLGNLHIAARAMGHMSSLSFALTLLPVAKHGVWLSAIGVGWESVLHWHRGLGAVAYITVTLHMALWLIKWAADGVLVQNLFDIDTTKWLWVTPVWNHYEDWSVLMAIIGWLFFTVAIIIAWTVRRTMYRLFYVAHHLAVLFMVFGLFHAWSFWMVSIPGLCMWWVDRVWRTARASAPMHVVRFAPAYDGADVTLLEFEAPQLARAFRPGQYAFVNVPAVSRSEWHPFTCNARGDNVLFLIKDMSPRGWTHQLAELASQGVGDDAQTLAAGSFTVGLYAGVRAADYTQSPALLVAGGIGITPVISVFAAAMQAAASRPDMDVTLVWIIQNAAMLQLPYVRDVLTAAGRSELDGVTAEIYITRHKGELPAPPGPGVRYTAGRPDMGKVVAEVVRRATTGGSVLPDGFGFTFACGPDRMQKDVARLSARYNFARSHTETFLF